ncbi:hypothetical protein ACFL2I_01635 [Candidatus Omnitrophota bacterium]
MKKVFIFSIAILLFCCALSLPVQGAGDFDTIRGHLNQALKLKQSGDVRGAIQAVEQALAALHKSAGAISSTTSKDDAYTEQYLRTVLNGLQANKMVYSSVIKRVSSLVENSRDLFKRLAEELKTGELSGQNVTEIEQTRQELSRIMVLHTFCVPPPGYKDLYELLEAALYRYSKAWGNLEMSNWTIGMEKVKLVAEALAHFKKGNELFSRAGTKLLAIKK